MVADDNSRLAQPEAEQAGWTFIPPVNSFLQPGNGSVTYPNGRARSGRLRPNLFAACPECLFHAIRPPIPA